MKSHVLQTVYTGRMQADLFDEKRYLEVMKRNARDSYVDAPARPALKFAVSPAPAAPNPPPVAASPAPTVPVAEPSVPQASAMTPHVPWTAYALTAAICLALLLLGLSDYAKNFLQSLVQ